VAVSFIGGGNRSTLNKPPTCRKSQHVVSNEYTSPELGTDCIGSCKSNLYRESKGEAIHRMYRNHDYFEDGSVHDTWRPLTIQTI
jgi:hypothetical protein